MNSPLKPLRTSIAEILAYAVVELFPGTRLMNAIVTDTQFSYCFKFTQPKHPELLPLLEEKMRGILKAQPNIELIEMSTKAAIGYFEHHEQLFKADYVESLDEVTVPLIRIGQFCDLFPSEPYQGDFSTVAFQLFSAEEQDFDGEKWIEIQGSAFFSKDELKAFSKHRKQWLKNRPWETSDRLGLTRTVKNSIALLPKGVEVFGRLEKFWRSQLEKDGHFAEVMTNDEGLYLVLFKELKKSLAQFAADSSDKWGPVDRCIHFAPAEQVLHSCISSLQMIHQTFNMLELNADWVLCTQNPGGVHTKQWKLELKCLIEALRVCGFQYSVDPDRREEGRLQTMPASDHPSIELRIHDSLGERHVGPFLSLDFGKAGGLASVEYSLLGRTKRLIAMMAERQAGKWPDCLSLRDQNVGEG